MYYEEYDVKLTKKQKEKFMNVKHNYIINDDYIKYAKHNDELIFCKKKSKNQIYLTNFPF